MMFLKLNQYSTISRNTAYFLLQKCERDRDLDLVRKVQCYMINSELDSISVLGDHLIRLFSSFGYLVEANQAFNRISKPSLHTWSAILFANAKLDHGEAALEIYFRLQQVGIKSNKHVSLAVLKACTVATLIMHGKVIHEDLLGNELQSDVILGSALVDMYAKCKHVDGACKAFINLPNHDIVSWGSIITSFAQNKKGFLAIESFEQMQREGIRPNEITFSSALKACANIGALDRGRFIHCQIMEYGLHSNDVIKNILIDMYAKSGSLYEACNMFCTMSNRNVVSWNSIIAGYVQNNKGLNAINCFERMQQEEIEPNGVTILGIVKACASTGSIEEGRLIHERVLGNGLWSDNIGNSFVDMYAKCGNLKEAQKTFHALSQATAKSWDAMIAAYAEYGEELKAVENFEDMQNQGAEPNYVVFNSLLVACSHAGLVDEAHWYFTLMTHYHGIVATVSHCTSMINLLGHSGYFKEAERVLQVNVQTDILGWASLLSACRIHGNLELGRHCFVALTRLDSFCSVGYILMSNMYADCLMFRVKQDIEIQELKSKPEKLTRCRPT